MPEKNNPVLHMRESELRARLKSAANHVGAFEKIDGKKFLDPGGRRK